jgi:predicted phosphodiesterase
MRFDVFSDVHLDEIEDNLNIKAFVKSVLPEDPSDLLIFAGDFGYDNEQNIEFLKELKKTYQTILFVLGNNDTKIPLNSPTPFKNARERVNDFLLEAAKLEGVIYLDHPVEVNGIRFGGSDIFFDFDDLKNRFGMNDSEVFNLWVKKKLHVKHLNFIVHPQLYTSVEKKRIDNMLRYVDVVITHGPPNYFVDPADDGKGFFRFDATDMADKLEGKVWIFGHNHQRFETEEFGCYFLNPSFFEDNEPGFDNKIITVEL